MPFRKLPARVTKPKRMYAPSTRRRTQDAYIHRRQIDEHRRQWKRAMGDQPVFVLQMQQGRVVAVPEQPTLADVKRSVELQQAAAQRYEAQKHDSMLTVRRQDGSIDTLFSGGPIDLDQQQGRPR